MKSSIPQSRTINLILIVIIPMYMKQEGTKYLQVWRIEGTNSTHDIPSLNNLIDTNEVRIRLNESKYIIYLKGKVSKLK